MKLLLQNRQLFDPVYPVYSRKCIIGHFEILAENFVINEGSQIKVVFRKHNGSRSQFSDNCLFIFCTHVLYLKIMICSYCLADLPEYICTVSLMSWLYIMKKLIINPFQYILLFCCRDTVVNDMINQFLYLSFGKALLSKSILQIARASPFVILFLYISSIQYPCFFWS